jgi:hypothetical protein
MKRLSTRAFLLISLALFGMTSCKPSLNSSDVIDRFRAIEESNDQAALTRVALRDQDRGVREAAVEKLTNQAILAKVAIEDEAPRVRMAAIRTLTDQELLLEVALRGPHLFPSEDLSGAAIQRIANQALLARAATTNSQFLYHALGHITNRVLLVKIAAKTENPIVLSKLDDQCLTIIGSEAEDDQARNGARLFLRARSACGSLPEHGSVPEAYIGGSTAHHIKDRFTMIIAPLLQVFDQPEIGEYSVTTEWHAVSNRYQPSGTMFGESFTCSVTIQQPPRTYSRTWSTSFPDWTELPMGKFHTAHVDISELLADAYDRFPAATHAFILTNETPAIRATAARKVTDYVLLARIARGDGNEWVARIASDRLTEAGYPRSQWEKWK